jgi:formylglycine-generating enzyme required for sulfatase activity
VLSSALPAGARIGRYLILERVGSGAMGVVYGAYDPELDRRIALKLLGGDQAAQEESARARLLREAKAMARLADPNVIAVHDVGVFEGRVFLAMEFLGGGTLKSWLGAGPRGWRQVLEVFVAAGRGLAAAHAAGLVHRDFKPDNVLLDREGRPRVGDFGLARDADAAGDQGDGAGRAQAALAPASLTGAEAAGQRLATLTRTGAIMGTPAYMAPEQVLGEPTDERTDQFGFCVALYEALYGELPFTGESLLRLLHSITEGQVRPPPQDRPVPAWIRRAVLRGLKADPAARWPSMAPLIAALEDDPAARRRRRLLAVGVTVLVLASVIVVAQSIRHRRAEVERQVAPYLEEAARSARVGHAKAAELRELRRRAFAAFELPARAAGEALWKEALAVAPAADAAYERAEQASETALVLDPDRPGVRAALADLLYEHVLLAEELRRNERARVLAGRLERHDEGGARRAALEAPGTLSLRVRPQPTALALERYERAADGGRRVPRPAPPPLATGAPTPLPPGSYRLVAGAPGRAEVSYPFEVLRGQRLDVELDLPAASAIPRGFAYVPPGELWFGDADEQLRTGFLGAVPIHRRRTGAYLIARHEATYAEWIAFLDSLPPAERARRAPSISTGLHGASLRLREVDGQWQLTFQAASQRYVAAAGQPLVYQGRQLRKQQDWTRWPVAGISPLDAERYLHWLRASGQLPGARMCTELEWERAARGADDRVYPHGDELHPDDADFDQTYGRIGSAFGPDEVGSHPTSRSPFGVDDLAGNVLEIVTSSERSGEIAVRGGAYYFSSYTARATNREVVPPSLREVTMGLRVCASMEGGSDAVP